MQPPSGFFYSLLPFKKSDTFDFEIRIGYVKKALVYYYCFFNHSLGKGSIVSRTDIVSLDITDEGPAILMA